MAENGTIKISNTSELYSLLPEELRQEFEIGIHGFSDRNYGSTQIDTKKNQQAKEGILSDGLKIRGDRKLLSTVKFGEWMENDYIIKNDYPGGVIVALPKVLRSESGEEIFIGSPVEDKRVELRREEGIPWDRNRQATSLSEVILPNNGTLDSMFIIGTYTKSENGIEVELNPNHISFNEGKVPDDFFYDRYSKLTNCELEGLDNQVVEETILQQQSYKGELNSSVDLRTIERKQVVKEAQALIDYLSVHGQDGELSKEDVDMILGDLTQFRTMGLDDMADTIKKLAEKIKIKDERIERLSMAIAEMREAGITDEMIADNLNGEQLGGIDTDENFRIIIKTFQKYKIFEIKKDAYGSQDDKKIAEMDAIIDGVMGKQEQQLNISELEKRRMQGNGDIQTEDVPVEDIEISSAPIQEDESGEIEYVQPESSEMYDAIDRSTEEEIVSLTELGEKSYKHFGSRIVEKLKETVNALKSRFFSRDKEKEDMTNGR